MLCRKLEMRMVTRRPGSLIHCLGPTTWRFQWHAQATYRTYSTPSSNVSATRSPKVSSRASRNPGYLACFDHLELRQVKVVQAESGKPGRPVPRTAAIYRPEQRDSAPDITSNNDMRRSMERPSQPRPQREVDNNNRGVDLCSISSNIQARKIREGLPARTGLGQGTRRSDRGEVVAHTCAFVPAARSRALVKACAATSLMFPYPSARLSPQY